VSELRRQGAKSTSIWVFNSKKKSNGYGKLSALHLSPSVVLESSYGDREKENPQRGKLQMKN
jgi:hypothetical protein